MPSSPPPPDPAPTRRRPPYAALVALVLVALDAWLARWLRAPAWRLPLDAALLGGVVVAWRVFGRPNTDAPAAAAAAAADDAQRDALTDLLRREAFESALAGRGAQLPDGSQLAVMVLDLYQFGAFNQRWGRDVADRLLQQLAARLAGLAGQPLLARVGADAFALAFDPIKLDVVEARMAQVLGTLRAPFDLADGKRVQVTAALGCALYPADTAQVAALLGLAEAALFNRAQRLLGDVTTDLDPYGELSAELLGWASRFLRRRGAHLVEAFYRHLNADASSARLLGLLDADALRHLHGKQESYLLRLLDSGLDQARHARQATHLGHLHAMLGVPARALVSAIGWYQEALTDLCQRIPGRLSQRQLLLRTINRRLEIERTLQTEAAQALQLDLQKQLQQLTGALHGVQRWTEALDATLDMLRAWPFVGFCAVYAQDAHGRFLLEAQTTGYDAFAQALHALGGDAMLLPMLQRCWASGRLETLSSLAPLQTSAPKLALALERVGQRSVAAVPIVDGQARIQAVIVLHGRLPNQFDTPWMNDLLLNLRQALSQALQTMRLAAASRVSASDRALWRNRLFHGGLTMYLQPIVQLPGRRCGKVETLARLRLADGRIVTPGQFLPVLSDQELNRLFIEGLDQSLDQLEQLQRDDIELDLSFNLPPVTLRHADCMQWVRAALARRHIAPQRVTFELLENEDIADQAAYSHAILELHALGVQLAMDDLGSGYSSLLRLRTLPFDLVKIDQGLMHAAERSPQRAIALVGALVRLARGLDLRVAIEGLESDELLEMAEVLGAELAQGYALARPMPLGELAAWLGAQGQAHARPRAVTTRMGALAAHWLWEQDDHDAAAPDPERAHLRCAVGQFLALHELQDGRLAEQHAELHRLARAEGVHGAAYLQVRDAFYTGMAALQPETTDALLPS